jgi:large subunit ribosomal protein L9
MKVLLCQDMKALGWLGDVVEVSTGYARNYLLPRGLAIVATEANLKSLDKEKAKRAEQRKDERQRLEETASAVDGAEAVVAAKANEQGILFGSVGAREIAANLREQGFEVADDVVALIGPPNAKNGVWEPFENIKQVGTHSVSLKFDKDLTATVNVVVVAQASDVKTDES